MTVANRREDVRGAAWQKMSAGDIMKSAPLAHSPLCQGFRAMRAWLVLASRQSDPEAPKLDLMIHGKPWRERRGANSNNISPRWRHIPGWFAARRRRRGLVDTSLVGFWSARRSSHLRQPPSTRSIFPSCLDGPGASPFLSPPCQPAAPTATPPPPASIPSKFR